MSVTTTAAVMAARPSISSSLSAYSQASAERVRDQLHRANSELPQESPVEERSFVVKRASTYRKPVPRLSEDTMAEQAIMSQRGSGIPLMRITRQASVDADIPQPALGWRLLGAIGRAWRAFTCQSSAA